MSTTPPSKPMNDDSAPTVLDDYRTLLAAHLADPATYWALLASLLSMYAGLIRHEHRRCSGCRICGLLNEIHELARAHNSLQTFNEVLEIDEPYSLLSHITVDRTAPATTGASN